VSPEQRRLLVVSHPCVVPLNQAVYLELRGLGWDPTIVVPARWRSEYDGRAFEPSPLEGLEGALRPLPVAVPGREQRHFYRARLLPVVRSVSPAVAFVEQEPFSVSGFQWGRALRRSGVPYGLQMDENLDRPLPLPARLIRSWAMPRADFVAARSDTAAKLARSWGAQGTVAVAPHGVPLFDRQPKRLGRPFTVGYAGRLVPQKGLDDLLAAVRRLDGPARLLLIGDGPMREALGQASLDGASVEIRNDFRHDTMPLAYGEMDVLVLPSRTTERWAEQFGRVLVEGLFCGVPVVGSDSGEIPWVIRTTGGGRVFPEGDRDALAEILSELRAQPEERERLARAGRERAERLFGVPAAARALHDLLEDAARG
jgi:glycosyltransferase involved in cell wall biosynthesis